MRRKTGIALGLEKAEEPISILESCWRQPARSGGLHQPCSLERLPPLPELLVVGNYFLIVFPIIVLTSRSHQK